MGEQTNIRWTNKTWNPWRGCVHVSPGCEHCYMYTAQRRYGRDPAVVVRCKSTFYDPVKWHKKCAGLQRPLVFTCSWSDFFIAEADPWREEAWGIIRNTPSLHYQILTKRPARILRHLPPDWCGGYPNVWLGVSVESRQYLNRVDTLRQVPARVRFLSLEPLLEDLGNFDLTGIGWVIVGGESGPRFRPMDPQWARNALALAQRRDVPFFFKQHSDLLTEKRKELDCKRYEEFPTHFYSYVDNYKS